MHAVFSTAATKALAKATSSTLATQQGPTFQAAPEGPESPVGKAMITPSGSVCAGYGELDRSCGPEPPSPWKSTTRGTGLVPSYFEGTCRTKARLEEPTWIVWLESP